MWVESPWRCLMSWNCSFYTLLILIAQYNRGHSGVILTNYKSFWRSTRNKKKWRRLRINRAKKIIINKIGSRPKGPFTWLQNTRGVSYRLRKRVNWWCKKRYDLFKLLHTTLFYQFINPPINIHYSNLIIFIWLVITSTKWKNMEETFWFTYFAKIYIDYFCHWICWYEIPRWTKIKKYWHL